MSGRLRQGDAFGRALLAHLNGIAGISEICERDDGFISALPVGVYFAEHRRWPRFEREAIRHARGRVLDIGCGAGRAALHLQRKGRAVTGIDVSPLAVRVCRRRGLKRARVLPIERLGELRPASFDTALLYGNNFGLFGSARRFPHILRHLGRILADDGIVIAETLDPYKTTVPEHLAYHRRNRRRGRMTGQVRLRVRYEQLTTPWFDYLFVSRRELRELLRETGWRVRRIVSSKGPQYVAILERA